MPRALSAGACILLAPALCALMLILFAANLARLRASMQSLPKDSLARRVASPRGAALCFLVALRYRVKITGLAQLQGKGPFLFLSNHPSLLDPFILYASLDGLRPRFLADENQFTSALLRWVKNVAKVITIPDYTVAGPKARAGLLRGLAETSAALAAGDQVAVYPAGLMQREHKEKLHNTSSVSRILQAAPNTRVIAVRVSGMWGSSFSRAGHNGEKPDFMAMLKLGACTLLSNFIFFTPRRTVHLHFAEASFILDAIKKENGEAASPGRKAITAWLETYFNHAQPPAMSVPRYFWQKRHKKS